MGEGFLRRGVCVLAGIVGVMVGVSAPAAGQSAQAYRRANPRALVDALKTAPAEERHAIAEAMIARRAEVLPTVRETVRSGDRTEKVLACSLIAEMRDRESLAAVLDATADRDVVVRRRAATVVRILADGRARPRLRALLQSETDLGVLKTAIAALGRVGQHRDRANLQPFLAHRDHGVQVVAAGALAMLGDQSGLDLVLAATVAAEPGVQKSATYALGLFADARAAERLRAILDDPDGAWKGYALIAQAQRRLARQSLAEQIATLDTLAHGRSRTLAEWAVDRLTDIGGDEAAGVLRKLQAKSTPVGRLAERRAVLLETQP